MNFKDYQDKAWTFAVPTAKNQDYILWNFVGEVGEFFGKMAKFKRDGNPSQLAEHEAALKKELGDMLWQLVGIATLNGWNMQEIADGNIKKLEARKAVFTIQGNGDDR